MNQGLWWDEVVYLGLAKNIATEGKYQINAESFYTLGEEKVFSAETIKESFRPPLFTYILSIFATSDNFILIARYLAVVFSIFSLPAVYLLGKKFFNEKIGLLASLIFASTFLFVFFSQKILAESLFILLSAIFLLIYIVAANKRENFFVLAGILLALSFLTRYFAILLGIFYLAFPFFLHKKIYQKKFYWLGLFFALLTVSPWMFSNYINFGSPVASLLFQIETTKRFYIEPWYFYFVNWFSIFGFIGFFVIPAVLFSLKEKSSKAKFLLFFFVLTLLVFSYFARKELRYLISFLPLFAVFFAYGIEKFSKKLLPVVFVLTLISFLVSANFVAANSFQAGTITQAAIFLADKVSQNQTIMTNSIPWFAYFTEARVVHFPEEESRLQQIINEYQVSYAVIDLTEQTNPKWAFEISKEKFKIEKIFEENGMQTVWIFKVE